MIVVDTSALMTVILDEASAAACVEQLEAANQILISAGTLAEALIVAAGRNLSDEMTGLIDGLGCEIVAVTPASARRIAMAYALWGRGFHQAGLNFGDCFAYELAREKRCPILCVGNDFIRTDAQIAIQPPSSGET